MICFPERDPNPPHDPPDFHCAFCQTGYGPEFELDIIDKHMKPDFVKICGNCYSEYLRELIKKIERIKAELDGLGDDGNPVFKRDYFEFKEGAEHMVCGLDDRASKAFTKWQERERL